MKRVIIAHRWGGNPKGDWYLWLKKKLEFLSFKVEIPAMPHPSEPNIEKWVSFLEEKVGIPNQETILIGHSIGCQTILRYLEKLPVGSKVGDVIFVAGWFKLGNLEDKEVKEISNPWINTPIDFDKIKQKISRITVFLSSNEPYGCVKENEKTFKEKLGAKVIIEKNKGHFTEKDGIVEIPEVIDIIKKYTH